MELSTILEVGLKLLYFCKKNSYKFEFFSFSLDFYNWVYEPN